MQFSDRVCRIQDAGAGQDRFRSVFQYFSNINGVPNGAFRDRESRIRSEPQKSGTERNIAVVSFKLQDIPVVDTDQSGTQPSCEIQILF